MLTGNFRTHSGIERPSGKSQPRIFYLAERPIVCFRFASSLRYRSSYEWDEFSSVVDFSFPAGGCGYLFKEGRYCNEKDDWRGGVENRSASTPLVVVLAKRLVLYPYANYVVARSCIQLLTGCEKTEAGHRAEINGGNLLRSQQSRAENFSSRAILSS
jgi:hypothetical protein